MLFESLFEGSFRFADVTGFTVVACQLVYHTTFVLGIGFVVRCHWDVPGGGVGLAMGLNMSDVVCEMWSNGWSDWSKFGTHADSFGTDIG